MGEIFALFLPSSNPSVTQELFRLFFLLFIGIFFSRQKIIGVRIGGVALLFVGIFSGHFGYILAEDTLIFLQTLGLLLFIFAIGIQIGPIFFLSIRRYGLRFFGVHFLLIVMTLFIALLLSVLFDIRIDILSGIIAGSIGSTPSLASAQEIITSYIGHGKAGLIDPAVTYSIAYPIGFIGAIMVTLIAGVLFPINVTREKEKFLEESNMQDSSPVVLVVQIRNENLSGKKVHEIIQLFSDSVTLSISRIRTHQKKEVILPTDNTTIFLDDEIVIIGSAKGLYKIVTFIGKIIQDPDIEKETHGICRDIFVTESGYGARDIRKQNLELQYNIRITRILRGGIEFVPTGQNRVIFGDKLTVVGKESFLQVFEKEVGNKMQDLQNPNLLLLGLVMMLGILVGTFSFELPFLSVPIKLGLAAGPLLVTLFLSKYSYRYGVSFYTHPGILNFLKEFGFAIFFVSVGIRAGIHFIENFILYNGWTIIGYSLILSILPPLLILVLLRYFSRVNILQIIGLISGNSNSATFAAQQFKTDIPLHTYIMADPIMSILRILGIQVFLILLL